MDWFSSAMAECSPWSYVVLFGQVMLLAMLVERSVFLLLRTRIHADVFLEQIRKLVIAGNADRAAKLGAAAGDAPLGRVCRAGLAALGRGPFVLQEELDLAIATELPGLRRRLPNILLVGGGLAVVGVLGSWRLGAGPLTIGGNGPLPLGVAMPYASAMLGVASAFVAVLGWMWLASAANKAAAGLELCKQVLLDLGAQQQASR